MHPVSKGFMIATAVATMAIGGSLQAMAQDKAQSEPVKCAGLNACKGQGAARRRQRLQGQERLQGHELRRDEDRSGVQSARRVAEEVARWRSRCRTWATASGSGRRISRGSGTAPRASTGSR